MTRSSFDNFYYNLCIIFNSAYICKPVRLICNIKTLYKWLTFTILLKPSSMLSILSVTSLSSFLFYAKLVCSVMFIVVHLNS